MQEENGCLACGVGHHYPLVDGVPIFLLSETVQTHVEAKGSLEAAESPHITSSPASAPVDGIDGFVQQIIAGTNGCLYIPLIGKLREYPIPALRLPPGEGKRFLEIGCNWGRWCIAAARAGYRPIGIDPSLKGIRAARHVARQLGVDAHYVVADGRYLPFTDATFDQVFSYSVLQHLSGEDVSQVLGEMARVMYSDSNCLVQMPNRFGARCLYHQARRRFRPARNFEVRYWSLNELHEIFSRVFGSVRILVDGFFSLNPQISDVHLLPRKYRPVIYASEALRAVSSKLSSLTYFADSLYVSATRSR